jgi:hypothetical protein
MARGADSHPTVVIAGYVEQRNSLIIALFLARVFAISNEKHAAGGVKIGPLNSSNFVLPHRRRNRETNNSPNWDLLPDVRVQCRNDPIEFILSGTAVTLVSFPDKTEPSKGNAGKIDRFS